ncbi:MAG: DUF3090 family protein [Anaerolineae bacterium]|nr:DUF3090 family protein [Anaerolineae bacterium]MBN8621049.1 DUF3090 family protein [Anaerolineae bacterium]
MPSKEIELNPVDFITVGTIGPKGQRIFHLQGGQGNQLVSLIIEKEQAWALSEAIREMLDDLDKRKPDAEDVIDLSGVDMDLREPIEPVFRVAQMGLGYDEEHDQIVLVAQELVSSLGGDLSEPEEIEPGVVKLWCSRQQMRMLCEYSLEVVKSGRADPKQNGRLVYYWS